MVAYVLIYWIIGGAWTGGGLVTGQAQFGDLESCQAAVQQLTDAWATRGPNGVYGVAGGRCAATAMLPVVQK